MSKKRWFCKKKKNSNAKANKPLKISPLLLIYAAVFIAMGKGYEGLSYLVCVVLHEFAHAGAANKRGYELSGMTFTVFGAALSGKFEHVKSEDELAIAAAGPLCNACLAVVCIAVWWLFPQTYFFTMDFVWANVGLLCFNLLPVYPLDGGRIAVALLSKKHNRECAYRKVRKFGFVLGGVLIGLFLLSFRFGVNPSFLLVGIFTLTSAFFPDPTCTYHRLYRLSYRTERIKNGLPLREIAVFSSLPVLQAQRLLNAEYYTCFVLLTPSLSPACVLPEIALDDGELSVGATLSEAAALYKRKRKNEADREISEKSLKKTA